MTDFHVYIHRKATNGEIFYVGKGQGNRYSFFKQRNTHWQNTVNKYGVVSEIIMNGIQEWYAFELEIELIAFYGRKDLGYGSLVNWTDGGEGQSNPNQEVRRRMGESAKKRDPSVYDCHRGENNHMKTPESRAKLSAAKRGKRRPDMIGEGNPAKSKEVRKKISEALSGDKHPLVKPVLCVETGVVFSCNRYAEEWLKSIGKRGNVKDCALGSSKTAGGFRWKYIK